MSGFDIEFPDDLFDEMQLHLLDGEVQQEMLEEAGHIAEGMLKNYIKQHHKDTGELADSITASKPYLYTKDNPNGVWTSFVSATGRVSRKKMKSAKVYQRSKSGRMTSGRALYNTDKLWFLEYGRAEYKETPKPFMKKLTKQMEEPIAQAMQKKFEERMKF